MQQGNIQKLLASKVPEKFSAFFGTQTGLFYHKGPLLEIIPTHVNPAYMNIT
jgi:hypothetical protein